MQGDGLNQPRTHAGAFDRHDRFFIAGCIEPIDSRREEFMDYWGVPLGFRSTRELQKVDLNFDVICICSPAEEHYRHVLFAISRKPRVIFCEKPISFTEDQTLDLITKCKAEDIHIVVNYSRRWDPDVVDLKIDIEKKRRGELVSVTGIYNRGLFNNGSHLVDVLFFLFGQLTVVSVGRPVKGISKDVSVAFSLRDRNNRDMQIAVSSSDYYSVFELRFMFTKEILTMEKGGLVWRTQSPSANKYYEGYTELEQSEVREGRYLEAMALAVDDIHNLLETQIKPSNEISEAVEVNRVCEQIISQI